ncbi:MAG: DNA repair protein RecO [Eubacterium sp.]|nr:DNA repair protein RecO [Eubacterium sp.]
MEDLILVTGMVINTIPVGEYDKRLTILTKEKGKIQAFARGAKRPNSSFSAAAAPFVFGKFYLRSGKSAYNLSKAEIKTYFEEISTDLDAVYYGSYFLELADYYGVENQGAQKQLNLMYLSLKALLNEKFSNRLIRVIYELKTLVINGEYPEVFKCCVCGKEDDLKYFSPARGGAVCSSCGPVPGGILMEGSALYTLQYIISSDIDKLYTFEVKENVLHNLELIMKDYFRFYIDRDFRSTVFLE